MARKRGAVDEARATLLRVLLDTWHRMPVPYTLDWMAAWTIVAASLARQDLADAVVHAQLMLQSEQQPLPDALDKIAASAVDAWAHQDAAAAERLLREAGQVAVTTGHL